jgi:hypothetical protein
MTICRVRSVQHWDRCLEDPEAMDQGLVVRQTLGAETVVDLCLGRE